MSNSLIRNSDMKEIKNKFLELISSGYIESKALDVLEISRGHFLKLCLEDTDFMVSLDEARKCRADFWVSKIIQDVDAEYTKDEIPNQRLRFDKLQFLAKADNPERYGNNSKKLDISIDLGQFKLLSPEDAVKSLSKDPFAPIEVEYTDVLEDGELL